MNEKLSYHFGEENKLEADSFWHSAFTFTGSVGPIIAPRLLGFVAWAIAIDIVDHLFYELPDWSLAPTEIFGAALGIILVFRTNAGYDRWWEARKVWGGIVNQSRNLAIAAFTYGPPDQAWRSMFASLVAAFPYATRNTLRDNKNFEDIHRILGSNGETFQHLPNILAAKLGKLLAEAQETSRITPMAFLSIEQERKKLINYIGMCERIKKTPMPFAYAVEVRRLLFAFLMLAPLAIVGTAGIHAPLIMLLAAYPLLALDQIGRELQQPFCKTAISHLPLDSICHTIESNIKELYEKTESLNNIDK